MADMENDSKLTIDWLREYMRKHCLLTDSQKTLSSGTTTDVYFDCKRATLDGEFLSRFADWVFTDVMPSISCNAVGGPTMGADCMISAILIEAHKRSLPPLHGLITRKNRKNHGTRTLVENNTENTLQVLIIEDVITTGASVATCCDYLRLAGHNIVGILTLMDREEGGRESLEDTYKVPVMSVATQSDFF